MLEAKSLFPEYEAFAKKRKESQLKVAIYIRCDYIDETKNHDDREKEIAENIMQQEKMLRKYCIDNDYNIVKVYADRPLVDWEGSYMISDGVRNMVKDSFDDGFCKVILVDIFEMDTQIENIASSLLIIADNEIDIESIKQGNYVEHFDFSVEFVNLKKSKKKCIKEEKNEKK